MRAKLHHLVHSTTFNHLISMIVVLDLVLMGLEEFYTSEAIIFAHKVITYIYVIELALRWFGRENSLLYTRDGRNLFDLAIIVLRVIPEMGPLALLKLYRSTLVINAYLKIKIAVQSVINNFYLENVKRVRY